MKRKFLIFNFHSISDKQSATFPSMPVKVFRQVCGYLLRNFFIAPLCDIEGSFSTRKPIGVITFDDGFSDFHENALEILSEKNLTATHHLIASSVITGQTLWSQKLNDLMDAYYFGSRRFVVPELGIHTLLRCKAYTEKLCREIYMKMLNDPGLHGIIENLETALQEEVSYSKMMNREQIQECMQHGITFGSHTYTHKNLCLLEGSELEYELSASKRAIEEITGNAPCLSLAVPNGQYNAGVIEACKAAGYRFLLTTHRRSFTAPFDCFELPRVSLSNTNYWKALLLIQAFTHNILYDR